MKHFLQLSLILISLSAYADGLPLKDGRYLGKVLEFSLTSQQKEQIKHYHNCHLQDFKKMNTYTPYVFTLTADQSKEVAKVAGFSPTYFSVYETYLGFNDAGPHWNLALQFSDSKFEIPIQLLLSDGNALKEHEMQGWQKPNPCFPEVEIK